MNNYINEFMQGEVYLSIDKNDEEAVLAISKIIEQEYPDEVDYALAWDDRFSCFYDYWKDTIEDGWTICLFDKSLNSFNSYRGALAENVRKTKKVMTAWDILGSMNDIEINEDDCIMLLEE